MSPEQAHSVCLPDPAKHRRVVNQIYFQNQGKPRYTPAYRRTRIDNLSAPIFGEHATPYQGRWPVASLKDDAHGLMVE